MPFAPNDLIVGTLGRQVFVVVGTYPVPGLVAAFRAISPGVPATQIFVQNSDADVTFTWFVLAFTATPAGKPPSGSRVRIDASPLALFFGVPVTAFPITQPSFEGIVYFYFSIAAFPGPIYAVVVTPEGYLMLAQQDELTLLR